MRHARLYRNIILSFVIANFLILIGKDAWLPLFKTSRHYLDMLVTFISVIIILEYVDWINRYLNRQYLLTEATYKDITKVILKRKAEVYQYVGDEIVLSWDLATGVRDLNCIRCFMEIRSLLEELAPQYKRKFGVVPRFKAGLHVGNVTVGEIGVIKRDIAYSGDVLNTTARIQDKCNELGKELLFSKDMFAILPAGHIVPEAIGTVELRGKKEGVFLYTVQ